MRRYQLLSLLIILWGATLSAAFDYPAHHPVSGAMASSNISTTTDGLFLINPALSSNARHLHAAFFYTRFFRMTSLQYANGRLTVPWKAGAFGIGIQDFGGPRYRENRITVNFSRTAVSEQCVVGASVHYYQVSASGYRGGQALGIDVGIRYRLSEHLHAAGVIDNLNQPRLMGRSEEIPYRLKAGVQFIPTGPLEAHLLVEKDGHFAPSIAAGIAYAVFMDVVVRGGYAGQANMPTFGTTLKTAHIHIDYGLQLHSELGATHLIGISFNGR